MFSKAEDPVCGMQVRKREAVTATVKGKKYFFCSKECKSKFEQNSEKYLKSPEKAK